MARLARLIYNTNQWIRPSGSGSVSGFYRNHRFGYEEWLNNGYLHDAGYKYGFIEAFHKNDFQNLEEDIYLYCYFNGQIFIVGRIRNYEFLNVAQRAHAFNQVWNLHYDEFLQNVFNVERNINTLEPFGTAAINFRIERDSNGLELLSDQNFIHLTNYGNLNQHLISHRYFRLSKLYHWPNQFEGEFGVIAALMYGLI